MIQQSNTNHNQSIHSKSTRLSIKPLPSSTDLQLFALPKQTLIKKINILTHELMVHYNTQLNSTALNQMDNAQIKSELIQKEIIISSLSNNQIVLQKSISIIQAQNRQLVESIERKDKEIEEYTMEVEIYKKKSAQLQKKKHAEHLQKSKTKQNEKKGIEELKIENGKLRQNVLELKNKIRILAALNQQTQEKLAEEIVKNSKESHKINHAQIQNKENMSINTNKLHEPSEMFNKQQNSLKIENLSLKQQLRQIRQQLRTSQSMKQAQKKKIQEKQVFYSKMLTIKR